MKYIPRGEVLGFKVSDAGVVEIVTEDPTAPLASRILNHFHGPICIDWRVGHPNAVLSENGMRVDCPDCKSWYESHAFTLTGMLHG